MVSVDWKALGRATWAVVKNNYHIWTGLFLGFVAVDTLMRINNNILTLGLFSIKVMLKFVLEHSPT